MIGDLMENRLTESDLGHRRMLAVSPGALWPPVLDAASLAFPAGRLRPRLGPAFPSVPLLPGPGAGAAHHKGENRFLSTDFYSPLFL